jgi:glycosyltransferase involved in cell wall biosynthesis
MLSMKDKVILFIPVKRQYLAKWEYYQVDLDVLRSIYPNTLICTSIIEVIKNLRNARLIYCWWWHRSVHVVILARLLRIKVYVTGAIHMFDLSGAKDFYSKSFFYRLATRVALLLADRNLFISNDQYLQATSHLRVNKPVVILSSLGRNSYFSTSSMLRERSQYRHHQPDLHKKVFLTVCWHTHDQYLRKGVYETLQALAILKNETNFRFQWVIVGGSGNAVDSMIEKIKNLDLEDSVELKVDVSQEEKRKMFMESDLYIQPSWHEGFGNAVLEAMSHGLPALVSRYTAQPEVVGDCGFIAMEMSARGIFNQIMKFLELDSEKRNLLEGRVLALVERKYIFDRRLEALKNTLI